MPDDLQTMIALAQAIVDGKPVPRLPVEVERMALARTVVHLAEMIAKEQA